MVQMAVRLKRSFARGLAHQADWSVEVLSGPLEAARRRGAASAVFLVDLNGFHVLNNGLGRATGNEVLGTVAKRLERSVQATGQCLACGGDRFMVLVSEAGVDLQLDAIADQLMQAVRTPIRVQASNAAPLVVSACIGSALDDGASVEELVRCAEIALAHAKTGGLESHVRFAPGLRDAAEQVGRLERDLREALDTELLFLVYMPGVDIASGRVTRAEALLRWQHPERGVITASEFVPLLEKSGTIVEVGSWVLQEACMQAAAWQRRGMTIAVHVNLSARQLGAEALLADLRNTLRTSRLNPASLVLEVAEATIATDTAAMAERLAEFKALGVHVAMDRFGAAYATFSQLKLLPLDIVEFDRSLIAGLGREDSASALIHTLVEIADSLGLATLATGVEDEAQLKELRDAGCAGALGHLYSEPVDADALDQLFKEFEVQDPLTWPVPLNPNAVDENTPADPDAVMDEAGTEVPGQAMDSP
jgi:diguanylate cyclase (GGDEF)-like protein